ncbi:MAG: ISAzo13 family transposase [Chitinispirillales bacterium]|nr:ISAzo13 family transposase [Chitinispirillales bacterium]
MMEERIIRMLPLLDERQKRLYLANEAMSYGRGGISKVSQISKVSRTTITKGIGELKKEASNEESIRRSGGGRKTAEENYPDIEEKIRKIIEEKTYGDPMRVLSYTTESLRKIQRELEKDSIYVSHMTVGVMLERMEYSKQVNQKMLQIGEPHPDRNAQFEHINSRAAEYIKVGVPVISVDTKKKEKIGNFKNNGSEYRPKKQPRKAKKQPRKVLDHDFPIDELGKISPYGVYNLNNNTGFVNVGVSHDTSEFAVESISRWWETVGKHTFPEQNKIYITADSGGSNGCRARMWKYQLQQFADRTGLELEVSHFPTGASKWNKVEHRLFCYISKNWQGKPLIDVQTAVELIGSTSTTTGLEVICVRDDAEYKLAKKVSDDDFAKIRLDKIPPFESWNYRIFPR